MENLTNTLEQTTILDVLYKNQALCERIRDESAAIVLDIGTQYIDRVEVRCGRALSRPEFQQVMLQIAGSTGYMVECVRWKWVQEDIQVTSFTAVSHIPHDSHVQHTSDDHGRHTRSAGAA